MIPRAILTRIDRVAIQGRTGPILSACEPVGEDHEIEVFIKLSAGCDQQVVNLGPKRNYQTNFLSTYLTRAFLTRRGLD